MDGFKYLEEDEVDLEDLAKDDLEEAIRAELTAVNATSEGHPDRAVHFYNLGNHLYRLYLKGGSTSDLNEAIRIGQLAIDSTPENHPDRVTYLANLGVRFHHRYHLTASIDDLKKAMRIAQATVDATPETHPSRGAALHNLGMGLSDQFLRTGSVDDLEDALRIGQAALDATPEHHPDRAVRLYQHAVRFRIQYQETGSIDDLDKAICIGQAAINATDEDHPLRASFLNFHGSMFVLRYHRTGSADDLQEAFTQFTESLYESSSPHLDCLIGGLQATDIALMSKDYAQGAQFLTECLALLSSIFPRPSSYEDHLYILHYISGLGSLAASVFLRDGRSTLESLQALEQTRGVISGLLLDSRSDVSNLQERRPDLWSEYCQTRELVAVSTLIAPLNNANFLNADLPQRTGLPGLSNLTGFPAGIYTMAMLSRSIMIRQLDVLKMLVRKQPGFDRFQLPPTDSELRGLARFGPIAIFNVTHVGSDAMLITKDNVQVLSLPQLILQDLRGHVLRDVGGNRSRRDAKLVSIDGSSNITEEIKKNTQAESMRWIWEVAVKPVLGKLGLLWHHKPPPVLPCLWWVGGGLMALLPLHAAGEHSLGSTENTMSHVVSSYAPTLKALQFARKKTWVPPTAKTSRVLVVAMHKTQGHDDLNLSGEIAAIQQHVGSSALVKVLEGPTVTDVLDEVIISSVVHFACHGFLDTKRPSKSALLLGTGSVEELRLEDLQQLDHQLAQVAYLSACSTAEIGARNLIDESIHLASTFQVVGFRHVIGTLWGAYDRAAVAVAAKFYEYLLKQDVNTVSSVPRALHRAILDLKAKDGNSDKISLWAPFIHVGP